MDNHTMEGHSLSLVSRDAAERDGVQVHHPDTAFVLVGEDIGRLSLIELDVNRGLVWENREIDNDAMLHYRMGATLLATGFCKEQESERRTLQAR